MNRTLATVAGPICPFPTARSVYIHIPFCRHRCGYCNFSVIAGREDLFTRFLAAIDCELARLGRPQVDTIFLGGGTPTHLSQACLRQLFSCVQRRFQFTSAVEYSIEANPEDMQPDLLSLLSDSGVNRLSLGVQSFDDSKLQRLERGHSGKAAVEIIEAVARRISNLSIDLIFAAPDETLASWQRDLDTALALPIRHLSTYTLTYEKGTTFWNRRRRGLLRPADEDLEVEMYQLACQTTAAAGLRHYEISSFAGGGARCRHNLAYWQGLGWFAAGPGAARFVDGRREVNHRSPTAYLKRIEAGRDPTAESEPISVEQWVRERAAFGVRMIDGVAIDDLGREVGVDARALCREGLAKALTSGCLIEVDGRVKLTPRGILMADWVAAQLL